MSNRFRTKWVRFAREPLDRVKHRICTNSDHDGTIEQAEHYRLPTDLHVDSALDFGCGLGRNFPFLYQIADYVVGYDLPEMLVRCREAGKVIHELHADWAAIRGRHFDVVLASLVLQHLQRDELAAVLSDLSRMTPRLLITSRADLDDAHLQVLPYVEAAGFRKRQFTEWGDVDHPHWRGWFSSTRCAET